jgi:PleD family two-component response regulator
LEEICTAEGYKVTHALDGSQLLDVVSREQPEWILLDARIAEKNIFEVLRVLRADPRLKEIPVLISVDQEDIASRQQALFAGADDYITRPYRAFEVTARVRNFRRLVEAETLARSLRYGVESSVLRMHDGPQQLLIAVEYELMRAERYQHTLGCVLVKVQGLSELLAKYTQDEVSILASLSATFSGCIRAIDHLFRSSVDEFAMLLPETDATGARVVIHRLSEKGCAGVLLPEHSEIYAETAFATFPEDTVQTGHDLLELARNRLLVVNDA